MKVRIPSQSNPILQQVNNSSILGTLNGSFNIDLTSDLGKIKTTKTLLSKRSTTLNSSDFGVSLNEGVGAITTFQNNIWLISGQKLWVGGNSPSDSITADTATGTPLCQYQDSDLKSFNSALIAVNQTDVYRYNPGTVTWSSIHTFSTSGQAHLLETHREYAYFTFDEYKIGRVNTSWTVSTTGTGTFNPNLPGYSISFMKSDGNRLWIGYANTSGGANETTLIIAWDGSTENTASAIYKIDSRAILAGTIVDGVPYVVDINGRLLAFNGSFFQKIASFPLKSSEYLYGLGTKFNQRAIHPNGMTYDSINEEILINVSNVKTYSGTVPSFHDFSGGVWSYKKESGLTHKYSPSYQPIADSGTTNLAEYGQYNTALAGAIMCLGLRRTTGEKGKILFGATIASGSTFDTSLTSTFAGLFTDDTENTAQNFMYFYTPEIHTGTITETWNDIACMYQKLTSVSDKIIVKYRTEKDSPTTATCTWADIDRITTTENVSSYEIGDEVEFIQGAGSGRFFTISSISENSGTYTVVFSESMPSPVIGIGAIARFTKWKLLGEVTSSDTRQYKQFSPNLKNISPMIQIKVGVLSTGDNEMYSLYLQSEQTIK